MRQLLPFKSRSREVCSVLVGASAHDGQKHPDFFGWHRTSCGYAFDENRTNVYKLYRATRVAPDLCIHPEEQVAFYDPGLGSRSEGGFVLGRAARWVYNKISQATGLGITQNIIDC